MEQIEYRSGIINTHCIRKEKHNPISGHSWSEQIPTRKFYISHRFQSFNKLFDSVESAKKRIDELEIIYANELKTPTQPLNKKKWERMHRSREKHSCQ